jgi:hypothetical protein
MAIKALSRCRADLIWHDISLPCVAEAFRASFVVLTNPREGAVKSSYDECAERFLLFKILLFGVQICATYNLVDFSSIVGAAMLDIRRTDSQSYSVLIKTHSDQIKIHEQLAEQVKLDGWDFDGVVLFRQAVTKQQRESAAIFRYTFFDRLS